MVPVPGGVFWVYFTGVAILAAAVGIITNFKGLGALAAFLTEVLMLIYAFTVHLPHLMHAQDEAQRMVPMMSFLKDLGLAGGAWAIARLIWRWIISHATSASANRSRRGRTRQKSSFCMLSTAAIWWGVPSVTKHRYTAREQNPKKEHQ
jgi:hypothetical protein